MSIVFFIWEKFLNLFFVFYDLVIFLKGYRPVILQNVLIGVVKSFLMNRFKLYLFDSNTRSVIHCIGLWASSYREDVGGVDLDHLVKIMSPGFSIAQLTNR